MITIDDDDYHDDKDSDDDDYVFRQTATGLGGIATRVVLAVGSPTQPAGGVPLLHTHCSVQQPHPGGWIPRLPAPRDPGERAGRLHRAGRGPEVTTDQ